MIMDDDVADLERRWHASALDRSGTIHTLVRRHPGWHEMPRAVVIDVETGILGDRWCLRQARDRDAQVTLIGRRVAALLAGDDRARWHIPGDNLVVDLDLSVGALPANARIRCGTVVLEISPKPHTGCDLFRQRLGDAALRWVNARDHRDRRLRGVNARVIAGGTLHLHDRFAHR
jgi:hypothetical protein